MSCLRLPAIQRLNEEHYFHVLGTVRGKLRMPALVLNHVKRSVLEGSVLNLAANLRYIPEHMPDMLGRMRCAFSLDGHET